MSKRRLYIISRLVPTDMIDVVKVVPESPRRNPHVAAALLKSSAWKTGGGVTTLLGLVVTAIVVGTILEVSAAIADTDAIM